MLKAPDRAEAQKLVALVSEDFEYFRKHAMTDPHRNFKKKKEGEDGAPASEETAGA